MKTSLLKLGKKAIALCAGLLCFVAIGFGQATVTTDKSDYSPGEYVIVTGTGWTPGETVELHFDETPLVCPNNHIRYTIANSQGNIYYAQFLINTHHLGVSFVLTAIGQTSHLTAQTTFTDAGIGNINVEGDEFCAGSPIVIRFSTSFQVLFR